MEEFKTNSEVPIPSIFKETKKFEVEWFLEESKVDPEDFYTLAQEVSKDSEILFKTYHNLFSLQQEKSNDMLTYLINGYKAKKVEYTPENTQYQKLQFQVDVAEKLLSFIAKYGWQYTNNAVRTLEETLV